MRQAHSRSGRASYRKRLLPVLLLTSFAAPAIADSPQPTLSPLATIAVGASPGPIAVNSAAGLAYVLNTGDASVSLISAKSLAVTKVIPVGTAPVAIAIDLGLSTVFVANSGDGTVSAIKGTTASTWHVGGAPGPMVADTVLGHLYVADTAGNRVVVLNSKTGAVLTTLATSLTPTAMALNPATHAVFVANTGASGSVVVIDGVHDQIATTIGSLPVGATSISVAPQTNVALVTFEASNALSIINAADKYAVNTEMNVGGPGILFGCPADLPNPYLTAYDSARQMFFMSLGSYLFYGDDQGNFGIDDFWGLAGNCTNGSGTYIPYSGYPGGPLNQFALDPAAGLMSGNGGPIFNAAYNPRFEAAYTPLPASINPAGVAFDPVKSWAYFSDAGNNTVSVYDVTPHNVVPAYEGALDGFAVTSNYADTNPATGTVYVLRLNNLYAISESQAAAGSNGTAKNAAGVTTIPLPAGNYSFALVVNAATNKIYVADSANFFYSVDGATNVATLLPGMPANLDVSSLAVNSATNQVLLFDYFSGNLFVLDGTSETVVQTIPIGLFPRGAPLLVDPVKDVAYVVGSSVFVVDLKTATVTATIPLSSTSNSAALNPVNSRLYAVTTNSEVYVVNTSTNTLVTSFKSPLSTTEGVGVNPITGKYYLIGFITPPTYPHVSVFNGTTNKLMVDLSGETLPALTGADSIAVDPLNNTIYVGTERGTLSAALAAIDGRTNAVLAIPPSTEEYNGYALAVDLGTNVLAAGGVDYTNLFFPAADLTSATAVPVSVTMQGVSDASTIATAPLFRTHNTQPEVTITATGNYTGLAAKIVPTRVFFQVDGWQGAWTAEPLKRVGSTTTGTVTVTLPTLAVGRHILYAYANTGEAATIQNGASGPSSLVVSPTAAFVFTVER